MIYEELNNLVWKCFLFVFWVPPMIMIGHSVCIQMRPLKACTTVQPSKCRDSHETIAIIKQWIQNRVSVSVSVGDSVSDGLSVCQCPWSERRQTPKILIST